jgi:hypothetical protein
MAEVTPRIPAPAPPIVQGGPAHLALAQVLLKPLDIPKPPPPRIYISVQDDWWDLIALKVYGMRRGDEFYMHKLIEANYYLREVCHFPAGVAVIVPDLPIKTSIPLVPWKKASIVAP